jgi:hypothetical protein
MCRVELFDLLVRETRLIRYTVRAKDADEAKTIFGECDRDDFEQEVVSAKWSVEEVKPRSEA